MTVQRWRNLTEWPLAGVAVLFLVAYAWEVIGNLRGPEAVWAEVVIWSTWVVFVADYLVCLTLARPRGEWFLRHLPELAIAIVPALRPLRLLRVVGVALILERAARDTLRGRVALYACVGAVLFAFLAALAVLDAEQDHPDANITGFGDAMWWSSVTIATVGYGDHYPVTGLGRLIAVALMTAGIALVGTITATIASLFIDLVADRNTAQEKITRGQIEDLTDRVDHLTRLLTAAGGEHLPVRAARLDHEGGHHVIVDDPRPAPKG